MFSKEIQIEAVSMYLKGVPHVEIRKKFRIKAHSTPGWQAGKYRRKSKQGFRTKREAEAWLAEYSVFNGNPTLKKGTLTLFSDYFDECQQLRFGAGLKETTRESWYAVRKIHC